MSKVKLQKCPKCSQSDGYKQIEVTQEELDDALGCIECQECGTLLYPEAEVKAEIRKSEKLVEKVIKSIRKVSKQADRKCTNEHLEDDGYCTQCGRNHFGGEQVEHPSVSPTVGLGKKARVDKSVVYHTHVHLWQYDW